MRSISTSIATFASASDIPSFETEFIESADPADMQARVAAALAARSGSQWALAYVDLAGGGDGHTFVCTLGFAGALIGDGTNPETTRAYFFLASEPSALAQARSSVDAQIATLFSAPISASSVALIQTLSAGAAKGTRFMGCTVCTFTQID